MKRGEGERGDIAGLEKITTGEKKIVFVVRVKTTLPGLDDT